MSEEKREVVVDGAFPVVEVGVADPTGLHGHQDLPWSGVGNFDDLYGDRFSLSASHYGPDAVRHDFPLCWPDGPNADRERPETNRSPFSPLRTETGQRPR